MPTSANRSAIISRSLALAAYSNGSYTRSRTGPWCILANKNASVSSAAGVFTIIFIVVSPSFVILSLYAPVMAKSIKIHSRINNDNARPDALVFNFVKDMFDEVMIQLQT